MSEPAPDDFAELIAISTELAALDTGDGPRIELERRREELRVKARLEHLRSRSRADLEGELRHLRARLAALDSEKIDIPSWQRRTRGWFYDPEAAGQRINELLDEANASDVGSIGRRIAEIEQILIADPRLLHDDEAGRSG